MSDLGGEQLSGAAFWKYCALFEELTFDISVEEKTPPLSTAPPSDLLWIRPWSVGRFKRSQIVHFETKLYQCRWGLIRSFKYLLDISIVLLNNTLLCSCSAFYPITSSPWLHVWGWHYRFKAEVCIAKSCLILLFFMTRRCYSQGIKSNRPYDRWWKEFVRNTYL